MNSNRDEFSNNTVNAFDNATTRVIGSTRLIFAPYIIIRSENTVFRVYYFCISITTFLFQCAHAVRQQLQYIYAQRECAKFYLIIVWCRRRIICDLSTSRSSQYRSVVCRCALPTLSAFKRITFSTLRIMVVIYLLKGVYNLFVIINARGSSKVFSTSYSQCHFLLNSIFSDFDTIIFIVK